MATRLYLLDTSIVSHLIRQPQGPIAKRIADVGEDHVLTSVIAACELRYGAVKRGSRRLTRQVDAVLGAMTVLPLDLGIDLHYAAIRSALERQGTPIGANDMLIAAHACAARAVRNGQRLGVHTSTWSESRELARVMPLQPTKAQTCSGMPAS